MENQKNKNVNDLPPPAPPGLKYRDFQIDSIRLARTQPRILIADQMGVGKTIQVIGIINDNPNIRKVLIVCPSNLRINWLRELLKWIVGKKVTIGIATTKRWSLSDIIIINYEALKPLHRNIHETQWDLLVCDEAHYLKNPNSRRSLEIFGRQHADPIKRRPKLEVPRALFLTGTPIVNRPYELWPLVHYLAPDEFESRQNFIKEYCGGKKSGQRLADIGEKNLRRLHQRLTNTIMIRRMKKDVIHELPAKVRQVIVLPTDRVRGAISREQQLFRQIQDNLAIARLRAEMAKADPDDEVYAREVSQLRQVEWTSIQQISKLRFQTALAKVPLVIDHVNNILQHVQKVIVFAYHPAVAENIATEYGEAVAVVHGKITSTAERQRRIDNFQNNPQCRVFIGTMKVAGEGLTLTASQVVVFAEQDWTPSAISQCEDRSHRIGQKNSVLVQHLVLDKSLDALLAHRIVEKQETIKAALNPEDEQIASLYSLSKATPFIDADRAQVQEIAHRLTLQDIQQIHSALERVVGQGQTNMTAHDYTIISVLAKQEYLEPAQAALGFVLLRKHAA
jgi:SWI/SNF-related matrix-associated actin-dependent regulator 1 of chromatin subfamily A